VAGFVRSADNRFVRKKKILVSVEHSDGTAGVFADRAGRWRLSGYLEERGGTRLKGFAPAREGLDDDRFVHGGRLPPRATSAVIEDAAGREHAAAAANGAWVAITDAAIFARFPLRFTADDGEAIEVPGRYRPRARVQRRPVRRSLRRPGARGGRA
jgi:hypothetical protein